MDLDLDINNYSIKDLEQFFKLKPNTKYSADDVELREYEIREQLLKSGHINKRMKTDLIQFLTLAKQWLIDIKCKHLNAPTSIPKNYQLDTLNYPRSKTPTSREENLITPPPTQYIYTQHGDFFPGVLNPIEKRIITKQLCIDTIFRPNYHRTKSSEFTITLPDAINNVTSMQLTACELPHMWFTVSSALQSNSFTIGLYNVMYNGVAIPDTSVNVVIPDGNYISNTFEETLNNYFNNRTDLTGNLIPGFNFLQAFIDPVTSCTIIRTINAVDQLTDPIPYDQLNSVSYSPDFYFTLDFTVGTDPNRPLYKNLGWMMGFRKSFYKIGPENTYLSYSDYVYNAVIYEGYLRSESSFGSSIDNYLFLEIDDYHNNFPTDTIISINSNNTSSYLGKNILARLTLTSGANTIIDDNASDRIFKKREYFGPIKLEKMTVRLLNRYGEVVDMIQNDYSFTLELKQIYSQ